MRTWAIAWILAVMAAPAWAAYDMTAVQRVLTGQGRAISRCFAKHPPPRLDPSRKSTFTIGPAGKVIATAINTGDKGLDACLTQIVKPLLFPPPDGSVEISFPYPSDPT